MNGFYGDDITSCFIKDCQIIQTFYLINHDCDKSTQKILYTTVQGRQIMVVNYNFLTPFFKLVINNINKLLIWKYVKKQLQK